MGAPNREQKTPQVEVVFALDTTGSMGGLIAGAKTKIWSITNEILKGQPTPDVKIGLVAYRDKGDAYITKVTNLSENLDDIYTELMSFKADGGGDFPEHVNQALKDSLDKISWTQGSGVLRIIFLVGDAPPHEDYGDPFDHKSLSSRAFESGIIINAIRCGTHEETGRYWATIARLGGGIFATIEQSGGVVAVRTPFDDEITALGQKLSNSEIAYGERDLRARVLGAKAEFAKRLESSPMEAQVSRMAAQSRSPKLNNMSAELFYELENNNINLQQVKQDELPEELQKMEPIERERYLQEKLKERESLRAQIRALDEKRAAYIKEQSAKSTKGDDAFDGQVRAAIQEQAKKIGLKY
jgi:hypothetical protein